VAVGVMQEDEPTSGSFVAGDINIGGECDAKRGESLWCGGLLHRDFETRR